MEELLDVNEARRTKAWTKILKLVMYISMFIDDENARIVDNGAKSHFGTPVSFPHPGFGWDIKMMAR